MNAVAQVERRLAVAAALVVLAVVAVTDRLTPPQVTVAPAYAVALALCVWVRDRRVLWALALAAVTLVCVPLVVSADGAMRTSDVANRGLGAVALLVIGGVVQRWIGTAEALDAEHARLETQNAALESSNAELTAREEEIARQNEELQSQREELERRGEELRASNAELARRERTLGRLLDLARALGGELERSRVMSAICHATRRLVDGEGLAAAAILVVENGEMRLHCHSGFGDDGPGADRVPLERSFASLVMSRGRAGYLPDVALRPDLVLPQPARGEPLRSVLGAPIRVRGTPVGTLEVYGREPREWTEEQIQLITSMAAQASISLETARLFEEVERERQRFETVLATLPIPVLVAEDRGCRRVVGNPAAAAFFTASLDANFSPFAPPPARVRQAMLRDGESVPPDDLPLVRAARDGRACEGEEMEALLPSGRRLAVLVSAAPLYGAGGHVVGAVCAVADITGQKALERELELRRREAEEASVRKTRFLAALSHDIRTPANAIRLLAELIRRSTAAPALAPKLPALAQQLQQNAVSLVDLVGEVLDLTHFDSGKVELQESEFSLADTIAEECRTFSPVAHAKGLRLECEPPDEAVWLRADRIKLCRIVGNLVENAIKFTPAGEVRVTARLAADGGPVIRIRDTGPGIAAADLPRIFDEFFQLRNPEGDRGKGRGLGLAICQRLVDAMGARLDVDSRMGEGTVFTLTLPATTVLRGPDATATAADRPRPPSPLAGLRVLLVEDHLDTRQAVATILLAEGAEVVEAADGAAALGALADADPHVVLLDLMLPDVDGTEVLEEICARRPPALRRILILTGDAASRRTDDLERLGADAVITKPVDPEHLVSCLVEAAPDPGAE